MTAFGENDRHVLDEPADVVDIEGHPWDGLAAVFCPGHGGVVWLEPDGNGETAVGCGRCGDTLVVEVEGFDD